MKLNTNTHGADTGCSIYLPWLYFLCLSHVCLLTYLALSCSLGTKCEPRNPGHKPTQSHIIRLLAKFHRCYSRFLDRMWLFSLESIFVFTWIYVGYNYWYDDSWPQKLYRPVSSASLRSRIPTSILFIHLPILKPWANKIMLLLATWVTQFASVFTSTN